MNSKLQNDINELLDEQIISQEVAKNIETYYKAKEIDKPNRLFTVFGVLGSILVGLGIILILAHNWDNFSKTIKTSFAFLPLLIGQFFVGYSILKNKSTTWRESSGTFLFFAVGSCISLIAQIYNIPGNLGNFLLTWTLLCIPLIYVLRSHAVAILCVVFATYYACEIGYDYKGKTPWLYFLLLAAILPHYILLLKNKRKANITSIFNWLLPLSFLIVFGAFTKGNGDFGFLMYVLLFGLFYNIGKIPFFDSQTLRKNGYLVLGSLGTMFLLMLTSFKWIWQDLIRHDIIINSQEIYISIVLFALILGILIYSYSKQWIKKLNLFQYVFIIFSVIFFIGLKDQIIPVILILTLGIMAIKIGADKFHFGILNYGLLIISILIVCRFFDTDMTFVVRGLLFVLVGAGFFLTNYIMLKKQKSREKTER